MDSSSLRGYAVTLGVIGLVAIVAGVLVMILGDDGSGSPLSGVLIRTGALLGAVALVLPVIKRPSMPTVLIAGAGLLLVLVRPALIWVALLVWLGWLVFGRQRSTVDNES